VDLVVLVTHLGLDVDQRMIASTTGIDVVLGGHNHIVLQPPKRVADCNQHSETTADGKEKHFILQDPPDAGEQATCSTNADCASNQACFGTQGAKDIGNGACGCRHDADCGSNSYCEGSPDHGASAYSNAPVCKVKRYCTPRDVVLAHSGAFAKFVGRVDLVVSNDKADLPSTYDPTDGFEVINHNFELFPVTENTPEDPIVSQLLEPYAQGLDSLANLDLLVGYALDASKRNAMGGGDSPLGNLIATAMWLRLGIQTDFSLTNTTGIRADLVRGPVTVEQMFNIFPFDNSITKMQLSGVEVQDLFDFVARRSAGRACSTQVQIAGARIVIDCTTPASPGLAPGKAKSIFIGVYDPPIKCKGKEDCPGKLEGQCDTEVGLCWQPIDGIASYELATSNYLAAGGSGFRVLQRNTTQNDTKVQQRDALIDYIRAGDPCGSNDKGELTTCSQDGDCAKVGEGYVCACPAAVVEGEICTTAPKGCAGAGACVLGACRDDVAAFQRATCEAAPTNAVKQSCEKALGACASGGEQCKFLACVDRKLGNFSDGRVQMVGQ
jgi:5'-nucleotidase